MTPLTVGELLALLQRSPGVVVEAALQLEFGGRATHFLCYDGQYLHDEGIDSQRRRISLSKFAAEYAGSTWVIDQMVAPA